MINTLCPKCGAYRSIYGIWSCHETNFVDLVKYKGVYEIEYSGDTETYDHKLIRYACSNCDATIAHG